jgi:hypothetical protein
MKTKTIIFVVLILLVLAIGIFSLKNKADSGNTGGGAGTGSEGTAGNDAAVSSEINNMIVAENDDISLGDVLD